MLCTGCGRDNAAGLDYCDYCGTELGAAQQSSKRKTEMDGGHGGHKRKTAMESPAPASNALEAALSGEVEDPFDPFASGGSAPAKKKAAPAKPAAPAARPPQKGSTQFDAGGRSGGEDRDPFAPVDDRYAGRRVVGWLITFDNAPDGHTYFIREGRNLVGRDSDRCDIVINDDDMVSSQHAVLVYRNGRLRVADDKSQNGTFLNEDDVLQPEEVADGAVIRVGRTRMLCRLLDPDQVSKIWGAAAEA